MKTFMLTISTPDGNAFCGQAEIISLRGSEGDLAVMAGHAPFITTVKAGECRLKVTEDDTRTGITDSGLLTVSGSAATLLTNRFSWK